MNHFWLHKQHSKELILFCNGWGMDEKPFTPLASHDYDVCMLYDYSRLDADLDWIQLLDAYQSVHLLSWSMGVWVAQQLFHPFAERFSTSMAINGTICPIDKQFGIAEDVYVATLENFDEKQRLKFYYRMCRDRALYQRFLKWQPDRSIASQVEELRSLLQKSSCLPHEESIYTRALVAEKDLVFQTSSQLRFWPKEMVKRVDGSHFLFYLYASWDELVSEGR